MGTVLGTGSAASKYLEKIFAKRPSTKAYRGIAQSGSAPALGAGCREFESLYPDQNPHEVILLDGQG